MEPSIPSIPSVENKQPIPESTDRSESASGSNDERDAEYMRRALALAQQGWGQTAPNPMVGAVVVRDGVVVGEGFHARYGEPHAEVVALKAAGEKARGATMYVNLEPCNHFGKTPPCTEAILAARVNRVVIGAADPTEVAAGGGAYLTDYGVEVQFGVEGAAARELNAPFLFSARSTRPWVTLKLALSSDWKMNDPSGGRRWISNEKSRLEVQRLRADCDAIAVGVGTVKADDPRLTARGTPRPRVAPMRVIFDRNAETPLTSVVVRTASETQTIIFAHHPPVSRLAALHNAGVDVFEAEDLIGALEALRGFEVQHLIVEGGARVAREFLRKDLVDRLVIFQSPVTIGSDALSPFESDLADYPEKLERIPVSRRTQFDDDTLTVYALHEV
ncbi:MAG TPA: bifunctional diaminohydroxyphosphoribosylaminopyrimidine deaminase/5-amino-6-(5-phosphoribosylamino)uracil reductase RibD [Gemmatimonadaceae bacterium]|nr:bifunctional diaminohydroxyphosphoribosylaminopyrimidine deaminase/5-amino-6-(5-phosphoribosylamino)uracil reductase RibD [Gemmatimonadaceae bacterium]